MMPAALLGGQIGLKGRSRREYAASRYVRGQAGAFGRQITRVCQDAVLRRLHATGGGDLGNYFGKYNHASDNTGKEKKGWSA